MKEAADDIAQGEGLEHIADTEAGENLPKSLILARLTIQ